MDGVQLDRVGRQDDDLAVVDAHDPPGEGQDARQVGGDAGYAVGQADHQAGALLDGVEPVVVAVGDDKGIVALQIVVGGRMAASMSPPLRSKCRSTAWTQVSPSLVPRTVSPSRMKQLAQLDVVDDVAVVSAHHVAVRVEVRLGVVVGGRAKGGPTKLGDARAGRAWSGKSSAAAHIVDRGRRPCAGQSAVGSDGRAADRIVAAIGQPAAGVEQNGPEGLF